MIMSHKCLIAFWVAAGVLFAATVGARPAYAQARYTSRDGYSFVAPARWQFDDADISMGRVRYVLTTSDTRVVASLAVRTVTDKGTTLDGLADAVRQTAKDGGDKVSIVREKKVSAGGTPGIVIETSNARPSEPDTEMTFITVRNGIACKIVLACKTAVAAKYAPAFNKAVSTFRWK